MGERSIVNTSLWATSICAAVTFLACSVKAQDLPDEARGYLTRKQNEHDEIREAIPRSRYFAKTAAQARRKLPFGRMFVLVNLPSQTLYAFDRNGNVAVRSKVVIGTKEAPTPVFRGTMISTKWFPDWSAPASIGFERLDSRVSGGMMVRDNRYNLFKPQKRVDDLFQVVPVDWRQGARGAPLTVTSRDLIDLDYLFYIPPSNSGPMGKVKILVAGGDGVFLHDTDQPALFNESKRLFSHGCVRVEKALALAAWLHGRETEWADEQSKIEEMRYVKLRRRVPVVFGYFLETDFDGGRLVRHDDVYEVARSR
ncbi:MAG: L,D-transpeptidase family protein [Hyphomicrobiaceae bacterium]